MTNKEFKPEYFSGLNWRDAEKLVGKKVEFSNDPDYEGWTSPAVLEKIDPGSGPRFKRINDFHAEYIRTCPETCTHPTITIGGVELPRPELEAPKHHTETWFWKPGSINSFNWVNDSFDNKQLKAMRVHLTKDRAQAWADWWDEAVVKKMKGE